jgi:hypothetical protein
VDISGPARRANTAARHQSAPQPRIQTFRTFPIRGTPYIRSGSSSKRIASPSYSAGKCLPSGHDPQPRFFAALYDWGYPDSPTMRHSTATFRRDYGRLQAKIYCPGSGADYRWTRSLSATPVDYVYDDHDFMNDNAQHGRPASVVSPELGGIFALSSPTSRELHPGIQREHADLPLVNDRGIYPQARMATWMSLLDLAPSAVRTRKVFQEPQPQWQTLSARPLHTGVRTPVRTGQITSAR